MITVANYLEKKDTIDWSKVPANIKQVRDDVEQDFDLYDDAVDVKKLIDLYIDGINKSQNKAETPVIKLETSVKKDFGSNPNISFGSDPKVNFVDPENEYLELFKGVKRDSKGHYIPSTSNSEDYYIKKAKEKGYKMVITDTINDMTDLYDLYFTLEKINSLKLSKTKPAPKSVSKKTLKSISSKTIVDNFSTEFLLIRRFYNIIKVPKSKVEFRTIQLMYNAFNKAALERKVRKTSKDADIFNECKAKVKVLFEEFAQPTQSGIEINFQNGAMLEKIKNFVTDVAVNPAIGVLKRYVLISNTKPDTKKAQTLLKAVTKILETNPANRLAAELKEAKSNLIDYIDGKDSKIEVENYALSRPSTKYTRVCRNRVKCAGISKNGRLLKGYMFEADTNNVLKVVKERLGEPRVCHNRVKCAGISKNGKLLKGYKFRPETNEVIYVGNRTTTKRTAGRTTAVKKKM